MAQKHLAIIIPTKDRASALLRLLSDIAVQYIKPRQIVIVDGGADPVDKISDRFPGLKIDYVRKIPPSLTAQRNAGIKCLADEASLVAFLDDDVVLEKDCIANMMRFWDEAAPEVGGAAFNLKTEEYKAPTILERIFLVNGKRPGGILRSGFQSKVARVEKDTEVRWLVGCSMVWRKEVFDEFMFDENFTGYARYEEVDFGYRVGKRYRMFIVADAMVTHPSRLEDVDFSFDLGRMEAANRLYFVRKYPELSTALCYWGLAGLFLNNITKGILCIDRRYVNRARGNLAGILSI